MDYYVDIRILPCAELSTTVLMSEAYSKLHKALCELNSKSIGVSFPKFNVTLCDFIRLHGSKSDLEALQDKDWLGGMLGYCKVSEILRAPTDAKFRSVSRKQAAMSTSKLNRLINRESIPETEIRQYKDKMFSKNLCGPYVNMVSSSNGQNYRRYIEFGELQDNPVEGKFDHFGLSKTATIPWF